MVTKLLRIAFTVPVFFVFLIHFEKPHGLLIDTSEPLTRKCVIFIDLTTVNIHFTFNSAGFIEVNIMY